MASILDEEFGTIILRRSAKASSVRIRVAPDGRLRASLPLYAPAFLVKRLIRSSREQLRNMLATQQSDTQFEHGMQIGKSHTLIIRQGTVKAASSTRHGQQIIVTLPSGSDVHATKNSRIIRDAIIDALRLEAKSYLPKRLTYLANTYEYDYAKVRFSHASGRWGSCSSNGTISLNIALMKLPFELIDYVLIHELSHTKEMNHSESFWRLVEIGDPHYKKHRQALKNESPSI